MESTHPCPARPIGILQILPLFLLLLYSPSASNAQKSTIGTQQLNCSDKYECRLLSAKVESVLKESTGAHVSMDDLSRLLSRLPQRAADVEYLQNQLAGIAPTSPQAGDASIACLNEALRQLSGELKQGNTRTTSQEHPRENPALAKQLDELEAAMTALARETSK